MDDLYNDPMFLRQIIMDHYQYPRNKQEINDNRYYRQHMASDSCIDDITVQMLVEQDTIEDVKFSGVGCAISTASTSIMTELLKGKSLKEARQIIENYQHMIFEKSYDPELLKEAIAFKNVGKQANRIKCALIGWKGIAEIMETIK